VYVPEKSINNNLPAEATILFDTIFKVIIAAAVGENWLNFVRTGKQCSVPVLLLNGRRCKQSYHLLQAQSLLNKLRIKISSDLQLDLCR
jgi:3-deoxy-D-manno-octulosonic-acid transferase